MVRRHLGFSIDEWEALPWHHQLAYMEGMEFEFGRDEDGSEDPDDLADDEDQWDGLGELGVTVKQV